MRPIERIKPYISLLKSRNNVLDYDELEKFWLENPDLRFTQVCVNTGLIPNIPGFWYYTEDLDFMLNLGFEPREVMLWGTYGKNLDQPLKYVFLKEMSNSHIQAVLDNVKSISERYRKEFENELKYRKENNIKIEDL
jgi:hypothetical protein